MIDRTSEETKRLLIHLARGSVVRATAPTRNEAERTLESLFIEAGLPAPDANGVTMADVTLTFAWRSHFVAATSGEISHATQEAADAKGWTLFHLSAEPSAGLPEDMIAILKE
jgi:hypothetical protein